VRWFFAKPGRSFDRFGRFSIAGQRIAGIFSEFHNMTDLLEKIALMELFGEMPIDH